MKKIILSALITLSIVSISLGAISYSVKDFLSNIEINTTQMPAKGWARWTTITSERGCYWLDFSRINETPKVGWKPAWDYINQVLIPTFGNAPLTDADKIFCFGDLPAIVHTVQKNGTYATRPMYDGELWLKTRDTNAQWKEVGRVEVGNKCEPEVIRKTTYNYHWVNNKAGLRGLTACSM